MTIQILNIAFGETPVSFRTNGFLNATAIAKHFGKVAKDYLKTEQTKEYIKALAEYLSNGTKILVEEKQLVIVKNGAPETGGGTWLHPKLAIHFARWLDPKFAVWCDFQIEKILGINQEQAADRLTDEQVGYLYNQVMRICAETGQAYQTVFGGLKRHFQVASYKHIKAADFAEACRWLGVSLPIEKGVKRQGYMFTDHEISCFGTAVYYAWYMSALLKDLSEPLQQLGADKLGVKAWTMWYESQIWLSDCREFLYKAKLGMAESVSVGHLEDSLDKMSRFV